VHETLKGVRQPGQIVFVFRSFLLIAAHYACLRIDRDFGRMMEKRATTGFAVAVLFTVATMLLWGFAHRLYATLLPGLGTALALTPAQADMARSAVAIGYFVMTLPTAFISRNFGYKIGMLFGLGTFAVGFFLLYPAVEGHSILLFIAAASVFGSGLAMVDVTTGPFIVFLGTRKGAIQRLVLADALSPLGALAALVIGHKMLAGATTGPGFAHGLVVLFSGVGVAAIVLAFAMEMVKFPPVAEARIDPNDRTMASFLPPLRIKAFRYAVLAIFLGLFAQIIIAGFAPLYSRIVMPSLTPRAAQMVLFWAYLALLIGRLVGPLLMVRIAPMRLVFIFGAGATLCAALSAASSGPAAIACLIGASFFMSILIPAIFAHVLRDLGDMAKSAAAVSQFVAFTGTGAFALVAVVNTPAIVHLIMIVPALCFGVITILVQALRRDESAAPPRSVTEPSVANA
jgi:FHS family L-fucose permease-like MFS transporter